MNKHDLLEAENFGKILQKHNKFVLPLPGIHDKKQLEVLSKQIVSSLRRIRYIAALLTRQHDNFFENPFDERFDPIKAAINRIRVGDIDEAFWLTFLLTHFGKHETDGWQLMRDVYGAMGNRTIWTWNEIYKNPGEFIKWLNNNYDIMKADTCSRRFSNHRKYESLDPTSLYNTGDVLTSYVETIRPYGNHQNLITSIQKKVGQNPSEVFNGLYHHFSAVNRFGRLAKFDFLTMIGKIGIAPIEPGSTYISKATGPRKGAQLLFKGDKSVKVKSRNLEKWIFELDKDLQIGMQAIEDSLCNWQKKPYEYVKFKG